MRLQLVDWMVVFLFLAVSLAVGLAVTRRAWSSASEYFLSGRTMPWWLLGVSMVATTFSTDTPNLVTDIVRTRGVAGNWVWWAFLLTGMTTTIVYARLWRRSGVETDVGFYELRYSGAPARFLRGFRAVYLGAFFNVMIMATVALAAIKIGGVMIGVSPLTTVLVAGGITVVYARSTPARSTSTTRCRRFTTSITSACRTRRTRRRTAGVLPPQGHLRGVRPGHEFVSRAGSSDELGNRRPAGRRWSCGPVLAFRAIPRQRRLSRGVAGRETALREANFVISGGLMTGFVGALTIFGLASYVGVEVIKKVPPTLHTPLMSGSNAISGITIVGALILAGDPNADVAARIDGMAQMARDGIKDTLANLKRAAES